MKNFIIKTRQDAAQKEINAFNLKNALGILLIDINDIIELKVSENNINYYRVTVRQEHNNPYMNIVEARNIEDALEAADVDDIDDIIKIELIDRELTKDEISAIIMI